MDGRVAYEADTDYSYVIEITQRIAVRARSKQEALNKCKVEYPECNIEVVGKLKNLEKESI